MNEVRGLIVGGCNISNLRYADDIVLIADSREKLQEMLDIYLTGTVKQMGYSLI